MKKVSKEWFANAPWGKIALTSWGNHKGLPVLLVHGRQDSSATFIPILEYFPEMYYYVAIDLPGHGKSDPFPIGVTLSRILFVSSIEFTIKHLGWDTFIYVGHSMGCDQGLFFNAIHPNKIRKFIFFDPIPSLQRLFHHNPEQYYSRFYEEYYSHYRDYNDRKKLTSKRKAMESVMRARGLDESQAELVLSRNLIKVGEDMYRLSWDRRLKFPAPQNLPTDYYIELFSSIPTTLIISATTSFDYKDRKVAVDRLIENLLATGKLTIETVEGNHDVHLIRAKQVAEKVLPFLMKSSCKSKL